MSINRVVIHGNLTADPEEIANGKGTSFSVAVNDRYKKDDEWQDYTSYFDVKVWGGQAEPCRKYLSKGSPVVIDGNLRQERWEKDGNKRSRVTIAAQSVQFVGAKKDKKDDDDIPF